MTFVEQYLCLSFVAALLQNVHDLQQPTMHLKADMVLQSIRSDNNLQSL